MLICFLLLLGIAGTISAGEEDVWVGTRFNPDQCLEIAAGKFAVPRKLCTITYDIRSENDHFSIKAHLKFNKMYIPDTVSDVELAILLIDENRVCTKQLNIKKKVEASQTDFAFAAQRTPNQRYLRAYYVIHYHNS